MPTLLRMCWGMALFLRTIFASLRGLKSGFSANGIPLEHLSMGALLKWAPLGNNRIHAVEFSQGNVAFGAPLPQNINIFRLSFPEPDSIQEVPVRLKVAAFPRGLRCLRKLGSFHRTAWWLAKALTQVHHVFSAEVPAEHLGPSFFYLSTTSLCRERK